MVDAITEKGSSAIAIRADVSQEDQVQAMFARMFERFGTIDILVNNAGVQKDARFEEMTLQQWNTVIGVNLTGQFLCAREAVQASSSGAACGRRSPAPPARSSA